MAEEVTYSTVEAIQEGRYYWSVWVEGSDGSVGHGNGEYHHEAYEAALRDAMGLPPRDYVAEEMERQQKLREKFDNEGDYEAYCREMEYRQEMQDRYGY